MDRTEQLEKLLLTVRKMRMAQVSFFAERDRDVLKESKRLEREVDRMIDELSNGQIRLF